MNRYNHILGCLLGTAVGDAVGLRREGLSRQRAMKMYGGSPLSPNLLLGLSFCSDDTEHTQMVGRALIASIDNVEEFERHLANQLRAWLLTVPAGVGLATVKACCKLLLGFSPKRSGVFSAGNGPAMRSAILGVCIDSDTQLCEFIRSSTRITHTDPKAEEGALLVARAARLKISGSKGDPVGFIDQACTEICDEELRTNLQAVVVGLKKSKTPLEYCESQGWSKGVSGYVNHTVPAALYCWANSPDNFRQCVENAVLLGGDTDSVTAIAGAICGSNLGVDSIPAEWINQLSEWPRTVHWNEELAKSLVEVSEKQRSIKPPSMHWLATYPRNLLFTAIVLGIGFRRLLPPY
ncbi:MAG: hypothetical protein COA78_20630 [Blastopirellula sp.]|nr:MAG: hypothetical protein COA78_20630 [Blastopirellula sp.]